MQCRELIRRLGHIAPLYLAEEWDNVGLLLGKCGSDVTSVLLTIDMTPDVIEEATGLGIQLVVAYHPVIFDPIKSLADTTVKGAMLIDVLHAGMGVYCPHTALDAVAGGVTDWLCDGLEPEDKAGRGGDRRALVPFESQPPTQQCKLVTFVPHNEVDRIRGALATAGAGLIGMYEQCSFSSPGTGTFRARKGANPTVGEVEQLEHVREVRLEMVLSKSSIPLAIETLQRFHPYEESAIDVHKLQPIPDRSQGLGRRLVLDQPVTFVGLMNRFRDRLSIDHAKYRDVSAGKPIQTIGVCPGSGGSLLQTAIDQGCELFVTGEMRHHDVLSAAIQGCSVILAGHTNTERGYLPIYKDLIVERCPDITVHISEADRTALLTY
ncbi:MAG: Nif3-like dinuclear metal center hexameric protein [Phycisphaerales bacterium]|nr:Nif3-like dinuclear metal center hexameric protein [Phycisphaerales bacterium]